MLFEMISLTFQSAHFHDTYYLPQDSQGMKGLYVQLDLKEQASELGNISFDPLPAVEFSGDLSPFLCCIRQYTCRYGPSGWPFPGVGWFKL